MTALRKKLKPILVGLVLVATLAVFVSFFRSHPEVGHQLRHTPPELLVLLLGLYFVFVAATGWIMQATVLLCRVRLGTRESLLMNMYSAVINFFGPLQSGPAFRAAYLKKRHNLSLKQYGLATLCYYALYGMFSVGLLLSPVLGWWLLPLSAVLTGMLAYIYRRGIPLIARFKTLNGKGLSTLALATLAQVLTMVAIYYVELRSVQHGVRLLQAASYAGAANLALFVSITPGAIGFRESFLVFSQHLHHISNSVIVSANIIDRSVYICLLLILMVIIGLTHAQKRFGADKKPV